MPVDRLTRRAPSPFKAPLVVSVRRDNALHIHALDGAAAAQGLFRGQALAAAQAMAHSLHIVPADEKADAALLEAIADWCDRFTPYVATDAPDGLLLDISGAAHLCGGEAAMLSQVMQKIAAQGFVVRGAIAGTSLAARALARHASRSIAPPGGDAGLVAPLPLSALACEGRTRRALNRAGLKTVGQVAARGRSELAERFGKTFVTNLDILLGRPEQVLNPRRPLPDLMAERHFAEPVTSQDAIAASLLALAGALREILEREGQGARLLEAMFFRADGALRRLQVRSGAPLRDPAVMMRLLREKLDALADPLDPGFGFDLIRLEAVLAEKSRPHVLSFDADQNAQAQIGFLIDRLSARFGGHRVLRFVPQDTHIPEAQSVGVPAQDSDHGHETWTLRRQPDDPPRRPLRLFERAEEVHAIAAVPDGPPLRFRWRRSHFDVTHAEGPERLAMEWWKGAHPTRDYFRVETQGGQRFWLYRDGLYDGFAPRWYLQGIFA